MYFIEMKKLLIVLTFCAAVRADYISVREVPFDMPTNVAAVISWVEDESRLDWDDIPMAFSAVDDKQGLAGKGWFAAGPSHLFIRLATTDRHHLAPEPDTLWAGDGIELGIDARGDGTRGLDTNRPGLYGPDDSKFIIAMTKTGPVCMRTHAYDAKDAKQTLPLEYVNVSRDEKTAETVYSLRLPWTMFGIAPGLYPSMGIAVQFNNQEPGEQEKRVLKWGAGTYGPPRPGLYHTAAFRKPEGMLAVAALEQHLVWEAGDAAVLRAAVSAESDVLIKANFGSAAMGHQMRAEDGFACLEIHMIAESLHTSTVPYTVRMTDMSTSTSRVLHAGTIEIPAGFYRETVHHINDALRTAREPLLQRHLKSVRALIRAEWARLELYRENDPLEAAGTHRSIKHILAGLKQDAGTWTPYAEGKRLLFFSYVSPKDRTLQFYQFTFPHDWDREKAYPLFFELHGSSSENPLAHVSRQMLEVDYEERPGGTDKTAAARHRDGFYCLPFGRGNQGYREIGEVDVWEAYDDVHRHFKIDEDRRYLYGFSMGGFGAWHIGTRTPDRWAAMAILAGGLWRQNTFGVLGRNLQDIPLYIWCGDRDFLFPYIEQFKQELFPYGVEPVIEITEGLGHNYRADVQDKIYDWLKLFVRKRPDRFEFVADTFEHTGIWGIRMNRDLTVSALPSFTCRIDGQDIHIDSEGTRGVEINCGEGGLGLDGLVKIYWNGSQEYDGPADKVTLGVWPERGR